MITTRMLVLACALACAAHAAALPERVLFVLTAADHLTLEDGGRHPTGFYANELAEPYDEVRKVGFAIDIATPGGRRPTCDPRSLEARHFATAAELEGTKKWLAALPELQRPLDLAKVRMSDYAGLFVPGGHGPMEDLVSDPEMGRLLREALDQQKAIGALCHGPGALLSVKGRDGAWPFKGYRVTAFSDAEEPPHLRDAMKFTPEAALRAKGAIYSKAAEKYGEHFVSDRGLVTGQNPKSARATGRAFAHALGGHHINGPNLPNK